MGYRDYSTSKGHIVDATGHGDFTTVSAAITAAVSGETIFIRPGTYIENPTLKAGVNLVSHTADGLTPNVTILGTCAFSEAGTVSISGIQLQTNGNFALEVTGSVASIVNIRNCSINAANNTAINFTSSTSSSQIHIDESIIIIGSDSIAFFDNTSPGAIFVNYCTGGPSGTASTSSSGNVFFTFCAISFPITTSSDAGLHIGWTNNQLPVDGTVYTINGTGANFMNHSHTVSGNVTAIVIGTGANLQMWQSSVNTSATDAIGGTGALVGGIITFSGTSATISGTLSVGRFVTFGGTIV